MVARPSLSCTSRSITCGRAFSSWLVNTANSGTYRSRILSLSCHHVSVEKAGEVDFHVCRIRQSTTFLGCVIDSTIFHVCTPLCCYVPYQIDACAHLL